MNELYRKVIIKILYDHADKYGEGSCLTNSQFAGVADEILNLLPVEPEKEQDIIKALSGEPIEDIKTVTSTEYEPEIPIKSETRIMNEDLQAGSEYSEYWRKQLKLSQRITDEIAIAFTRGRNSLRVEYASQFTTQRQVTDEEIEAMANFFALKPSRYWNGLVEGAKWMRDKIKSK